MEQENRHSCRPLACLGWPFINADELARELNVDPYAAAKIAHDRRYKLINDRKSFVFETVLSDPVGEKIDQLAEAVTSGSMFPFVS